MIACCIGCASASHLPRPEAISSGYRCVPLKRYPHLVFYRVEAGDVDVWCVLHAKRDIPHSMQEPDNHRPLGHCHVSKL
jgi:plasmid stabilization system protein ParE